MERERGVERGKGRGGALLKITQGHNKWPNNPHSIPIDHVQRSPTMTPLSHFLFSNLLWKYLRLDQRRYKVETMCMFTLEFELTRLA